MFENTAQCNDLNTERTPKAAWYTTLHHELLVKTVASWKFALHGARQSHLGCEQSQIYSRPGSRISTHTKPQSEARAP